MNKLLTLSYWGWHWKKNLLTREQMAEYAKGRLQPRAKDISSISYDRYCKILDDQIQEERDRLNSIESKAIQIVSQISIVLAIVALFVPFIIDKIPQTAVLTKGLSIGGLLLVALLFVYAIICALRNFDISKFMFVKTSESTIVDHYNKKEDKLKFNIINDKILELRSNRHSTNAKASNVSYAFRVFKVAILALTFYLMASSLILIYTLRKPDNSENASPERDNVLRDSIVKIPKTDTLPLIHDSISQNK